METQVEKYIHGLSDVDLLEYTRTATHLPEALEFAKIELADRHLPSDRLTVLDEQLKQREMARQAEAQAAAAEPLHWEWRIAVFLSGIYFAVPLLLFVPAWCKFRDEGLHQKYKDMWICAAAGLCLQPILILARIPPWSWLRAIF